jgi:hypothetical protein
MKAVSGWRCVHCLLFSCDAVEAMVCQTLAIVYVSAPVVSIVTPLFCLSVAHKHMHAIKTVIGFDVTLMLLLLAAKS